MVGMASANASNRPAGGAVGRASVTVLTSSGTASWSYTGERAPGALGVAQAGQAHSGHSKPHQCYLRGDPLVAGTAIS